MGIINDNRDFLKPLLGLLLIFGIFLFVLRGGGLQSTRSLLNILPKSLVPGAGAPNIVPVVPDAPTPKPVLQGTPPAMSIDTSKDYYAILNTNVGQIRIDLFERGTPQTVNNFVNLANTGFYNGLKFFRAVPNFMIQTGSPTNSSNGGPNYRFNDEIDAVELGLDQTKIGTIVDYLKLLYDPKNPQTDPFKEEELARLGDISIQSFYERLGYSFDEKYSTIPLRAGAIAMANEGPNTNGSQFFIILTGISTPQRIALDGRYTVFGRVTLGQNIVDLIGKQKEGTITVNSLEILNE